MVLGLLSKREECTSYHLTSTNSTYYTDIVSSVTKSYAFFKIKEDYVEDVMECSLADNKNCDHSQDYIRVNATTFEKDIEVEDNRNPTTEFPELTRSTGTDMERQGLDGTGTSPVYHHYGTQSLLMGRDKIRVLVLLALIQS